MLAKPAVQVSTVSSRFAAVGPAAPSRLWRPGFNGKGS